MILYDFNNSSVDQQYPFSLPINSLFVLNTYAIKLQGGDNVKKKLAILAVSALVASCLLMSSTALAGKDGNGNGFPSGPHYNLNILGKKPNWQYNASEEGSNTIFVRLDNKSQITMVPTKGTEFVVTDADAVHKEKGKYDAEFEIPWNKSLRYPAYDVYVRARGKPSGYVNISANFTYPPGFPRART